MRQYVDLTGRRFGRLVVLSRGNKTGFWQCLCDCGARTEVYGSSLRSGATQSCWCLRREKVRERSTVHGMSGSQTYISWAGMMDRCYRAKHKDYRHYGGRGIAVCDRWHQFESFLADMGAAPAGHTVERKDNDGPYSPDNCTWATMRTQSNNRRGNHVIEFAGKRATLSEMARAHGLRPNTLQQRLERGWSVARALATPLRSR